MGTLFKRVGVQQSSKRCHLAGDAEAGNLQAAGATSPVHVEGRVGEKYIKTQLVNRNRFLCA